LAFSRFSHFWKNLENRNERKGIKMVFSVLFLTMAGLAFWYGKNKCVPKTADCRAFYGVGVAGVMCAIAVVIEMIKAGSF
jgi:hypothetical protein